MKKILVLTESIEVNDSSGSKANVALIKNLIKLKHSLKVYHLDRSRSKIEGVETFAIKRYKTSFYYWLVRFNTLFSKHGLNFNAFIEKKYGFSFSHFEDVERFKKALAKEDPEKYDIVFTLSKASSFRPHKTVLESPKWHFKWYAYVHDPYPMHAYPRPYDWVEPGHQKKRKFFIEVSKKAHKLMYPSLYLAEWMESYYGKLIEKRLLIPHQIDHSIQMGTKNRFFDALQFIILHAGNLMSARKPQALVEAYKQLLENYPKLKSHSHLVFIGEESSFHSYFREQQKQLPQLKLSKGSIPFEEVLKLQADASVNVILEAKGPISPFLPGKFPHCVMAEKPILLLGPYYSESRRLLGMENYPFWAEIDDQEKIYLTLEKLYLNWKSKQFTFKYEHVQNYLGLDHLRKVI
ncbi:glycosyltransferase family 4 protein [Psychroflexus sp. YR1-1]|uniref:Glycosyltransferase family 4 protein n=1 Tax=Psychroflexus aurantiacus TaxID=2709310 RepID=A0A6B3R141_9FLAO|nr:glycosyltransferase family 4 protein [Psychroflexus aurantiacus]NEV93942.1 glycosyltransferase family 4 protein [Psychroflexus aurantiacus]